MSTNSKKNAAKLVLQLSNVKSTSEIIEVYNQLKSPSVEEQAVALFYIATLPDFDTQAYQLIDQTLSQVENMDITVVSSVIKALSLLKARNFHQVSNEQVQDIIQYVEKHLPDFDTKLLANLCYSVADLCSVDEETGKRVAKSIVDELLRRNIQFTKDNFINFLMVIIRFKVQCDLDFIYQHVQKLASQMKSSEAAQVMQVFQLTTVELYQNLEEKTLKCFRLCIKIQIYRSLTALNYLIYFYPILCLTRKTNNKHQKQQRSQKRKTFSQMLDHMQIYGQHWLDLTYKMKISKISLYKRETNSGKILLFREFLNASDTCNLCISTSILKVQDKDQWIQSLMTQCDKKLQKFSNSELVNIFQAMKGYAIKFPGFYKTMHIELVKRMSKLEASDLVIIKTVIGKLEKIIPQSPFLKI